VEGARFSFSLHLPPAAALRFSVSLAWSSVRLFGLIPLRLRRLFAAISLSQRPRDNARFSMAQVCAISQAGPALDSSKSGC